MGHCFSQLKKDKSGLRYFLYADTYGNNKKIQNNIIATMLNLGQYEKARTYIKNISSTRKDDPELKEYMNYILTYRNKKN